MINEEKEANTNKVKSMAFIDDEKAISLLLCFMQKWITRVSEKQGLKKTRS